MISAAVSDFKWPSAKIARGVAPRTAKARTAFSNLYHKGYLRHTPLFFNRRVCGTTVCSVLYLGLSVLRMPGNFLCLTNDISRAIARFWWEHRMRNEKVRRHGLGIDSHPLTNSITTLHLVIWIRTVCLLIVYLSVLYVHALGKNRSDAAARLWFEIEVQSWYQLVSPAFLAGAQEKRIVVGWRRWGTWLWIEVIDTNAVRRTP